MQIMDNIFEHLSVRTNILILILTTFVLLYACVPAFKFRCRDAAFNVYVLVMSLAFLPVMLANGRCTENAKWCCRAMSPGRRIFGLGSDIRKKENMIQDRPCVIVSNHQSSLDLFGMADLIPPNMTYLVKRELMYFGPLGLCFWLSGAVFIDRKSKNGKSVMQNIAQEVLDRKLKVWIFPEGTRHQGTEMLPFKKGAFNLAVGAQVPIVPVVYKSYLHLYNPAKNLFTSGTYTIEVLPPIETKGLGDTDVPELCERTREIMSKAYRRLNDEDSS